MGKSTREVVVTGIGMMTPLGIGHQPFWDALMTGRSAIRPLLTSDFGNLPYAIGSEIRDFDPKHHVRPRKAIKLMSREVALAFAAANLAVEDARLDTSALDHDRFGIVMGSEMFYGHPSELADVHRNSIVAGSVDLDSFAKRISTDMFPLWLLKYLPNMSACHVGIAHQAWGATNSIVQGTASALLALAESVSVIERGWCDVMLTGGGGSRTSTTLQVHLTDELLSKRSEEPLATPRPFDRDRDGYVRGEGACLFVLETREHAVARGATPICKVSGFGRSVGQVSDVRYCGATEDAIERSIRIALADAGLAPNDIDHVNAEGLATIDADIRESRAIESVLGETPVTAPKSYFGDMGAGAGAVEMAASVLSIRNNKVPPTLNYESADPDCPVNVVRDAPLEATQNATLVLNQSKTGQTVAAVLENA
jgi:3-oxoacyl-[acyl-carrier-protein] synthase II